MTTTPSKKSNGFFASLTDKEDNSTSPVASKQRKASTKSGDTMSRSASLARKSYTRKFRGKRRSSVTEVDFFEKEAVLVDDDLPTDERAQVVLNDQSVHGGANTRRMLKNLDNTPFRSRPPVRMDAEDGPWSVSVAELAHEPNSYNLYIRSALKKSSCVVPTITDISFLTSAHPQPHSPPNRSRNRRFGRQTARKLP